METRLNVKTATKTALGHVRSLGLVPTRIATQTKSGLAKDRVTYPAIGALSTSSLPEATPEAPTLTAGGIKRP